jgi:hypothetical protein
MTLTCAYLSRPLVLFDHMPLCLLCIATRYPLLAEELFRASPDASPLAESLESTCDMLQVRGRVRA